MADIAGLCETLPQCEIRRTGIWDSLNTLSTMTTTPALHLTPSHTFAGKRVLLTAGASGIGLRTALHFLSAGASVFISDVDRKALDATLSAHPALRGAPGDVSDEGDVRRMFDSAVDFLGGLDILVNNAGVSGPTAPLEEVEFSAWRQCMGVNLDSVFLCSKLAIPLLKKQRSGSIINLSSTAGLFGFPRRSPYAAAKWAIRGLTRTMAQELGPFGERVNCICPGSVEGDRMDRVIAAEAAKTGQTEEQVRRMFVDTASLKQFVSADDIANAILFLCSDAGRMVSGQDFAVDGHTETL
jgi:NAD(P)-dependent dehydrogenase (short-subunit alcohol dehydrogenase family)